MTSRRRIPGQGCQLAFQNAGPSMTRTVERPVPSSGCTQCCCERAVGRTASTIGGWHAWRGSSSHGVVLVVSAKVDGVRVYARRRCAVVRSAPGVTQRRAAGRFVRGEGDPVARATWVSATALVNSLFCGATEATDSHMSATVPGDVTATPFYTAGGTTVAMRATAGVSYLLGGVQGSATVTIAAVGSITDPAVAAACVGTVGFLCPVAVAGSAIAQTLVAEGTGLLYDWLNESRVKAAQGVPGYTRRFMLSDQFDWDC